MAPLSVTSPVPGLFTIRLPAPEMTLLTAIPPEPVVDSVNGPALAITPLTVSALAVVLVRPPPPALTVRLREKVPTAPV